MIKERVGLGSEEKKQVNLIINNIARHRVGGSAMVPKPEVAIGGDASADVKVDKEELKRRPVSEEEQIRVCPEGYYIF